MSFTNSSLVTYTQLSPNYSTRAYDKITKITIHHMAGNLSVEECGNVFSSGDREASSNYGIDSDGRVGMYVEEKNRSWCSSNRENDNRAVTIEVANCGGGPDWPVSKKAYDTLILLCVDICQRNGIAFLNYTGDSSGNLTRHDMFTATICPGPYLESRFSEIATTVNQLLGNGVIIPDVSTSLLELSVPKVNKVSTKSVTVAGDTNKQADIEVGLYRADNDVLITSQTLKNQQGNFSVSFEGLSQGTLYVVKFTTNFSGDFITSEECLFRTLYDRPKSVTNLSLVFNTDNFIVKFKPPTSWGSWDSTKYKRGYRVYLVKNGVISVFSDTLIPYNSTQKEVLATIKPEYFNLNINYGDSMQVGVQTYIKENTTPFIFDQANPVCTNALYFADPKYLPVQPYLITSKGYQRLSIYSDKIKI